MLLDRYLPDSAQRHPDAYGHRTRYISICCASLAARGRRVLSNAHGNFTVCGGAALSSHQRRSATPSLKAVGGGRQSSSRRWRAPAFVAALTTRTPCATALYASSCTPHTGACRVRAPLLGPTAPPSRTDLPAVPLARAPCGPSAAL